MTKIEELKAAYEAATQGEWRNSKAAIYKKGTNLCIAQCYVTKSNIDTEHDANAHLITLMHNNLPHLLEATVALQDCQNTMQNMALQIEQMQGMFGDEDGTIQAALEDYADTEMRARYALEKLK